MSDRGRDIFSMKPSVGFNETSIPPEFLRPFPLPLRHPAAGYPPRDNGRTRVPDLRPPMLAATGGPLHPPISALQLQHAHKSLGLLGLLPPLIPLNGVERAPLHLPHQVAMTSSSNPLPSHPAFHLPHVDRLTSSSGYTTSNDRLTSVSGYTPPNDRLTASGFTSHLPSNLGGQLDGQQRISRQLESEVRIKQGPNLLTSDNLDRRCNNGEHISSNNISRLKIFSPEELNYRGASLPNQNNLSHHNEDHRNHQGAALSSDEEGKEREMSNREREEYHRILDKKRGIKRKADLISGSSLTPPRVTSPTVNLRRLNLSLSGNTVLTTNHQTYTSRDHNQHQQHTPPERLPENGRPDGLQQPDEDTPLNLTSPRLKESGDVKKTATNSEQLKSLSLKERNSLKPNKTTAPKPRDGQSINKKSHRKEDRRTRLLDEGRRQRQAQQQQLQLQQKQAAAAGGRQNNNHQNNVDNDPDEQQELTDDVDDQNNTSDQGNKSTSTIDCPVCKDVAIAHFHYGGMCCYSCKAFFRRVVNTSKASKYKCRSGKNDCDISFANRRSCQACRYRKCVAAGMKPALVLSDEQCSKRFGHKKSNSRSGGDDPDDPDAVLDDSRVDASHQDSEVTKEDLALLIDGEKSYEEQNKIGRTLFVSLFDTGSVRNDGLEDRELDKYSSINETVAMVKSFQIERQLNHSRQYLPFNSDKSGEKRKLLNENGKVNTGDIAQTLIDQTIMLLRHNKHFNSLQLNDQTELLECNLMAVTLLTIFEAYHGTSRSVVWKLTEPDFAWLKNHKIKVPHGRLSFNIQDLLKEVDTDLKEEATKLFNFFDYFYQIGLPRASLYILLFVIVFNQNFAETKNKDDIEDSRKYYLFALFETLAVSEGVLGACSIAARLHSCLNDLTRIAQVLGQKFIDVEEN